MKKNTLNYIVRYDLYGSDWYEVYDDGSRNPVGASIVQETLNDMLKEMRGWPAEKMHWEKGPECT